MLGVAWTNSPLSAVIWCTRRSLRRGVGGGGDAVRVDCAYGLAHHCASVHIVCTDFPAPSNHRLGRICSPNGPRSGLRHVTVSASTRRLESASRVNTTILAVPDA
jgi:hypothetical protein